MRHNSQPRGSALLATAPRRGGRSSQAVQPGATAKPRKDTTTLGLALLTGLWIFTVFDPQWLLISKGAPGVLGKIPVLLFGALILTLGIGVPNNPEWRERWQWAAPFLSYIMVGVVMVPFALNNGYARDALQMLLIWWALIVGTVTLIGNVPRAEALLKMYGLQFLWWGVWGLGSGLVGWHHTLSNHDGYGALMVGGIGLSYFIGLSLPNSRFKWLMYVTAGVCALGVVASFARGAFLGTVLLYGIIWYRSPHKGATTAAGVAAVVAMVLAAMFMFEDGFFYNEIMSAFEEGTTEGTGSDRWVLWGAAWRVFTENPIFGAGPRNWGVYAAQMFAYGDLPGEYASPGTLYDRSLHNLYMTTLSELGIMGCLALLWILVDFWKRNYAMRTPAAQQHWEAMGGTMKLKPLALGLEAAMVGFLLDALIYSMMVIHWFYTMLALNLLLHALTVGRTAQLAKRRMGAGAQPIQRTRSARAT